MWTFLKASETWIYCEPYPPSHTIFIPFAPKQLSKTRHPMFFFWKASKVQFFKALLTNENIITFEGYIFNPEHTKHLTETAITHRIVLRYNAISQLYL